MIELYHSSTVKLWRLVAPYIMLRHKLDLNPKPWNKAYWVDLSVVGMQARQLAAQEPPVRQPTMRYNMEAANLRKITWNGETHHICEWARRTGLHHACIRRRLAAGWAIEDALTRPAQRQTPHT